jgi:hypothetical protein
MSGNDRQAGRRIKQEPKIGVLGAAFAALGVEAAAAYSLPPAPPEPRGPVNATSRPEPHPIPDSPFDGSFCCGFAALDAAGLPFALL